MHRQP